MANVERCAPSLPLGVDHLDRDAKWQAEREAAKTRANRGRSEKAKKQHTKANPRRGERSGGGSDDPQPKADRHSERRAAAAFIGVSPATYGRARELKKKNPEAHAAVVAGEAKASAAHAAHAGLKRATS